MSEPDLTDRDITWWRQRCTTWMLRANRAEADLLEVQLENRQLRAGLAEAQHHLNPERTADRDVLHGIPSMVAQSAARFSQSGDEFYDMRVSS